jgi:hypothetical protein
LHLVIEPFALVGIAVVELDKRELPVKLGQAAHERLVRGGIPYLSPLV